RPRRTGAQAARGCLAGAGGRDHDPVGPTRAADLCVVVASVMGVRVCAAQWPAEHAASRTAGRSGPRPRDRSGVGAAGSGPDAAINLESPGRDALGFSHRSLAPALALTGGIRTARVWRTW